MTNRNSQKKTVDEIVAFKAWVAARGGEVLTTTNEYELVRFRGDGVTSIIYVNKKGAKTFTGLAQDAWDAFKSGVGGFRLTAKAVSQRQKTNPPIVRTILNRDGHRCFYCGEAFSDEKQPTREHLVPVTAGGPNHISNLFLACYRCNVEAGHLSAPEKIRMRDRKRRGRGTDLLTRIFNLGGGCPDDLISEIGDFLSPSTKEKASG